MKYQLNKNKASLSILCLGGIFLSLFFFSVAQADVCFLPFGGCVDGDALSAPENCAGYSTQTKNKRGWNCPTCVANGHTYYKCEEKPCGAGYTAGIESCTRGYTHEYEKDDEGKYVYSGDKKCGKCVAPEGCPVGTQLTKDCEQEGFVAVETQHYMGTQVCYTCLDDNCYNGKQKYCNWSSGNQSGPSGSVRAKSREWYTSTTRTKYGSICYQCCDNVCSKGSQEVTSCNPNTELLRTVEYTRCSSACNECCNNQCSVGSLSDKCPTGEYSTTAGKTKCGKTCYSCVDCGGYKNKPSGCYSCESKKCGGEERWYCTKLNDSCPNGSSQNVNCASYETKTYVSTTDCGHECYMCKCTPLTNESQDVANCKTVSYQCSNGCGGTRTCYKSACGVNQTCQSGTCVDVCSNDSNCWKNVDSICGGRWTNCQSRNAGIYSSCIGAVQAGTATYTEAYCNSKFNEYKANCDNYKNYICPKCVNGKCSHTPEEPNLQTLVPNYSGYGPW